MLRGRESGSDLKKECDAVTSREYAEDHTVMVTYLAYLLVREAKIPAVAFFFFLFPFHYFISLFHLIVHSDCTASVTNFLQ